MIFLTSFAVISIENRMNASTFRDIWARVMFLKFSILARAAGECHLGTLIKNIASDHTSRNARAIIRFFIYDILNKILKESIFGTYFSVKHL